MANREEKKNATRQKIYDAALDLFCEMGYLKTTLADIAAEAEVSTRTLYKYFPTKESILRKFGEDNIATLREYADSLPDELSCREKVLAVMLQDYKMMFCLFDISYIVHTSRDASGMLQRFELRNVLNTQSIYRDLFKAEQERHGLVSNEISTLAASVITGIYRHCTDLYRFLQKGATDSSEVREYYANHIDLIWDSLIGALLSPEPKVHVKLLSETRLFGSVD